MGAKEDALGQIIWEDLLDPEITTEETSKLRKEGWSGSRVVIVSRIESGRQFACTGNGNGCQE